MATKINKEKLLIDIDNISVNMDFLSRELRKLSNNLNEMMKGNADGPYWNGVRAKKYYTKAINNLKNDIKDYIASYNKLNAIALKYEKLVKNDK